MPPVLAIDPPVSEAQRRAMFAAAAGHSTLGIPRKVGEEFVGKRPAARDGEGEAFLTSARAFLRGLLGWINEEGAEAEHAEARDAATLEKVAVDYSPGKGEDRCANCAHFLAPAACELVKGEIDPDYWCRRFLASQTRPAAGEDDAQPALGRAASIAFVTPDAKLLLLKRAPDDDYRAGEWGLPGGKAEEGEDAAVCAAREAREEIGDCALDGMLPLVRTRTGKGWDHTTFVVPVPRPFEPTLSREHTHHVWAPVTALPEPVHPGLKETVRRVLAGELRPGAEDAASARDAEQKRDENGRFAVAEGYKEVAHTQNGEPWQWAKSNVAQHKNGASHHVTIRHAGEPAQFTATRSFTKPNVSGASMKVGSYPTFKEAHEAAVKAIASLPSARDESEETRARHEGHLSETTRAAIGREGSARRAKLPEGDFLLPGEKKYPVKRDGKYDRNLLLAAAREARMHGRGDLARRADALRAREFGAEDEGRSGRGGDAVHDQERDEHGRFAAGEGAKPNSPAEHKAQSEYHRNQANTFRGYAAGKGVQKKGRQQYAENAERHEALARHHEERSKALIEHHESLKKGDTAVHDALPLGLDKSLRSKDEHGRLHVANSHLTKANVCEYLGSEIPGADTLGLDPDKRYRLLRDPEELSKPETVASFNNIPILDRHLPVSAATHAAESEHVIGATGTDAVWAPPYVDNSLAFWPQEAIDSIERGEKRELSAGYSYVPVMEPGTYEGEPYDGRMTNIRAQHIASVVEGRVGSDVAVADRAAWTWDLLERTLAA